MRNQFGRTIVPSKAVAPLIEQWMAKNNYTTRYGERFLAGHSVTAGQQAGGFDVLSRLSGVPTRRISAIANGHPKEPFILFDTADKLLCAMGMCGAWHHELAEFYTELETAKYERHLEGNAFMAA